MTRTLFSLTLACGLLGGCSQTKPEASAATNTAAVAAQAAPAPAAQPAAPPATHGGGHDCAKHAGAGTQLLDDKLTSRRGPSGETIVHVGGAFSDAPLVAVADLLAKPEAFQGKRVRIQGNVAAMCHHARGWFAVVPNDKSGRFVRVLTRPVFLVPADSIGKTALAEGTVEVIDVDAASAKHYAEGHKLGRADEVRGSQRRVVLRASGAEFI